MYLLRRSEGHSNTLAPCDAFPGSWRADCCNGDIRGARFWCEGTFCDEDTVNSRGAAGTSRAFSVRFLELTRAIEGRSRNEIVVFRSTSAYLTR